MVAENIASPGYCDSNISNTGDYRMSDEMAIAGNYVYVMLGGRHGADQILRVTMPAKLPNCNGTDSDEALEAHYAMQGKVMSSVKALSSGSYITSLAATEVDSEERVFYVERSNGSGGTKMLLWTSKTQKAEVIGEFKTEP